MRNAVAGVDARDEFSEHAEESMIGDAGRSFVEHDSIMRGLPSHEQWP
ncbi:hypothetical protein [Mycolicibacterium obuense]|nr:hypothetical protein [Mycolicibacterium obuense]